MDRNTGIIVESTIIDSVEYEIVIRKGGRFGGFAHISPRLPSNDQVPEVFHWAQEVLKCAGKKPASTPSCYFYPNDGEESTGHVPYGKMCVMFGH